MTKQQGVSRRNMLKGLGAGALGLAFFQQTALTSAQDDDMMMGLPVAAKYYGFNIGDYQAMVITDASASLPAPIMGANQDAADVTAFFESKKLVNADGNIPNIVDILVVSTGDDLILFDTGLGASDQLVATLGAVGISPADVTKVMISHFHPDHVGGLSNEGTLTFPNAEVFFSQPEWDFMESVGEDSPAAGTVNGAMAKLQPALDAGMVSYYGDGDSPVSGITAMAAHGHTPGHMAFMIENNGESLLNIVDSAINVYSGTQNPDWNVQFDAIPDMAVENRKRLFSMSSDDNVRIFGYHFPFPGIGFAVRQGEDDSWLWTPTSY